MKRLSVGIAFTFALVLLPLIPTSTAAIKAGTACTKLNQTSVIGSMKYTCVKSGKELVWNQGVKIKPNSNPTPNNVSFNPIPITLPVPQTGAITFSNIVENVDKIPRAAWNSVQSALASNSPVSVTNVVEIGPNTTPNVPKANILTALQNIQKVFSGFTQPKTFTSLIWSYPDLEWTKDWVKKNTSASPHIRRISDDFDRCTASNCGGGGGGPVSMQGYGFEYFVLSSRYLNDPFFTSGAAQPKEYILVAEATQFIKHPKIGTFPGGPNDALNNIAPCWLRQGTALYNGAASLNISFADFLTVRNENALGQSDPKFNDYSASSLESFFKNDVAPACNPENVFGPDYEIGELAVEALQSIAGPQSVMALFALMGSGQKFDAAFQNVYGISWSKAIPTLAKTVAVGFTNLWTATNCTTPSTGCNFRLVNPFPGGTS